jgi:hypothetical protein
VIIILILWKVGSGIRSFDNQLRVLCNLQESSKATADTLKIMLCTERARLDASVLPTIPKAGSEWSAKITTMNVGLATALNVTSQRAIAVVSKSLSIEEARKYAFSFATGSPPSKTTMEPSGQPKEMVVKTQVLTQSLVDDIRSGKKIGYIFVDAPYNDDLKPDKQHHLQRCLFYIPSTKSIAICSSGNASE